MMTTYFKVVFEDGTYDHIYAKHVYVDNGDLIIINNAANNVLDLDVMAIYAKGTWKIVYKLEVENND